MYHRGHRPARIAFVAAAILRTRVYEIFAQTADAYSDRLRFAPRKRTFSLRDLKNVQRVDNSKVFNNCTRITISIREFDRLERINSDWTFGLVGLFSTLLWESIFDSFPYCAYFYKFANREKVFCVCVLY